MTETKACAWCKEPVLPSDEWREVPAIDGPLARFHIECWGRQIIGSLAHVERRCSCFVEGAEETDPPDMTRREAAKAACAAYRPRHA